MVLEFVREIPDYCEVFQIEKWLEYVENGDFNDDGCGTWAKDGKTTDVWCNDVCNITEINEAISHGVTHICWFSK